MATAFIQQPSPFEPGNRPALAWEEWRSAYELYEEACEYSKKEEGPRRALLLHCIGSAARKTYKGFVFTTTTTTEDGQIIEAPKETALQILNKFDDLYRPYKNVRHASAIFNAMMQRSDQSIDEFVSQLKLQANDCDFGDKYDRLVGDRLIFGIKDPALRERLLRETDLPLDKLVNMCKSAEISRQHAKPISDLITVDNTVNRIWQRDRKWHNNKGKANGSRNGDKSQQQNSQRPIQNPTSSRNCSRCGTLHKPRNCPAYGNKCLNCNGIGHFAKVCRQKKKLTKQSRGVATLDEQNGDLDDETLYISKLTVGIAKSLKNTNWDCYLQINSDEIAFKLDTGSDVNILSNSIISKWKNKPHIIPSTNNISTYSGENLPIIGECYLDCILDNNTNRLKFFIIDMDVKPILGADACEELNLISRNKQVNKINQPLPTDIETILNEFSEVFVGLGKLPGTCSIRLKPNTIPSIAAPRKIPHALQNRVRDELQRMEGDNIIKKVTEPTDWVHPIVVVAKKNGGTRICLDPRKLNAAIKREHYKIPSQEELFSNLSECTVFSVLDASNAFWQLELDEASSYMCTFATPWGRYRFLRLPFGISSAPELYQRAIAELFKTESYIHPYFDDILLASKDHNHLLKQLHRALTIAKESGLKLNRSKTIIGMKRISYLGHVLSPEGISPDPRKVSAITAMKQPTNQKELMRFLGMATYLMKFVPHFSEKTSGLRTLLKNNTSWVWDENLARQFNHVKKLLSTAPVLQHFDGTKSVTISTDASSYGLGCVLLQNQQPIAYASATLTLAQQGYAQIEKELLAVVFACERFRYYILGNTVEIQTDHKPLIGLINKPFEKISPRLQRLLLRLQHYDVTLTYVPGKFLTTADTLSRAPDETQSIQTSDGENKLAICTLAMATTPKLQHIRDETSTDPALKLVIDYINKGWPASNIETDVKAREYYHCRQELHIVEGIVCRGQRLVIPSTCQADILANLHTAHRGIVSCKNKARQAVYWPTMNKDIEQLIISCMICQQHQKNNSREPLENREIPTRPWQNIGIDFFHLKGINYLLGIDYFSKYVELQQMGTTNAKNVILALKAMFARFGLPEQIISDNGPPFDSLEFKSFVSDWDIVHNPSSPLNPRSNGQIERTVQTFKSSLTKAALENKDLYTVLMDHRSTPMDGLKSPAELLMGRKIRTLLPTLPTQLQPQFDCTETQQRLKFRQQRQHRHGDDRTKPLTQLQLNQTVWFKLNDKWQLGKIFQVGPQIRSYIVITNNGQKYRRNRYNLRPAIQVDPIPNVQHTLENISTPEDYYYLSNDQQLPSENATENHQLNENMSSSPVKRISRFGRQINTPTRFRT